jgi:hypothetical protein
MKLEFDAVKKPFHYNQGSIEVIELIESWDMKYSQGNFIKYILRFPNKGNPIQDLQKALWYLDRVYKENTYMSGFLGRMLNYFREDIQGITSEEFLRDWEIVPTSNVGFVVTSFLIAINNGFNEDIYNYIKEKVEDLIQIETEKLLKRV